MKEIRDFPMAQGGPGPLTIIIDRAVPEFRFEDYPTSDAFMRAALGYYNEAAARLLDALEAHAPGGLVDAIFGELAHRKAYVFRVPFQNRAPEWPEDKR